MMKCDVERTNSWLFRVHEWIRMKLVKYRIVSYSDSFQRCLSAREIIFSVFLFLNCSSSRDIGISFDDQQFEFEREWKYDFMSLCFYSVSLTHFDSRTFSHSMFANHFRFFIQPSINHVGIIDFIESHVTNNITRIPQGRSTSLWSLSGENIISWNWEECEKVAENCRR